MKIRKISINRLFYNNHFTFIISLLSAIVLWMIITSMDTEDHPHAITNVPIVITLSDSAQADGLKIFSPTEQETAKVSIKGNSLVVNQVKATDMQVVALDTSDISAPGLYSRTLVVQKKGNLQDYTVDSFYPNQMILVVDRYKEKTFNIENNITYAENYQSDSSYFVGTPTLSSDTVTISGPEQDVQKVNRVAYGYEITDTLRETKRFTSDLALYDVNGNKITDSELTVNPDKVDVTIPVLPRQILKVKPTFTNKPSGFLIQSSGVSVTPSSVEVAGPQDVLSNMKEISLSPIDFSNISPLHNTFDVDISLPTTCKNLSNIPTAKVTLDLSGITTRTLNVSNFNVKNLEAGKTALIYTKSISVTVVGPEEELSKLTDSNLVADIDMSGKSNFTGHTEMPVTLSVSNTDKCWVYGDYMANIGVTQTSS